VFFEQFTLPAVPQYHPMHWYRQKEDADEDVTKLRYERYEAVRQGGMCAHTHTYTHEHTHMKGSPAAAGTPIAIGGACV
jgi:hypothetical protein